MSDVPDKIVDGLFISNLAARSNEEVLRSANIGAIVDLATLQVACKHPHLQLCNDDFASHLHPTNPQHFPA
jgi:hypothetical protein